MVAKSQTNSCCTFLLPKGTEVRIKLLCALRPSRCGHHIQDLINAPRISKISGALLKKMMITPHISKINGALLTKNDDCAPHIKD